MKVTIDTAAGTLVRELDAHVETVPLYTPRAFEILSELWVSVGWDQKYPYTFSWFGRPVIQLPEDMIRMQEVIYRVKPDVIVETGVAHGGSLVYYATLMTAMGRGRVIGIDIEIRPHNRKAIESHPLAGLISLVEGDSTAPETVARMEQLLQPSDKVMVVLDSNHSKAHVERELEAYHRFVTLDSYLVVTDGVMRQVADVPRGQPSWTWDNPATAAREFIETHPAFRLEQPEWPFNESPLRANVTHWPDAWLRRVSP